MHYDVGQFLRLPVPAIVLSIANHASGGLHFHHEIIREDAIIRMVATHALPPDMSLAEWNNKVFLIQDRDLLGAEVVQENDPVKGGGYH